MLMFKRGCNEVMCLSITSQNEHSPDLRFCFIADVGYSKKSARTKKGVAASTLLSLDKIFCFDRKTVFW